MPAKHLQVGDFFYYALETTNPSEPGQTRQIYGGTFDPIVGTQPTIGPVDQINEIIDLTEGHEQDHVMVLAQRFGSTIRLVHWDMYSFQSDPHILCDDWEDEKPQAITKTTDGYVVVTIIQEQSGCRGNFTVDGEAIRIMKLDFQYNVLWDRIMKLDGGTNHQVERIRESDDGGFLITGTAQVFSENNLFLIKTNSEGLVN
jgi:hypothetical protein